jgi:hypothetical protein
MKITKSQLKRIIKEELENILAEQVLGSMDPEDIINSPAKEKSIANIVNFSVRTKNSEERAAAESLLKQTFKKEPSLFDKLISNTKFIKAIDISPNKFFVKFKGAF